VLFENERTRVLEVMIATGQREPTHTHRWPSVMLVDRPARIRYYVGDRLTYTSPEQPSHAQPGPRVSWLDPEGPHSVENIDEHPYGAFRIEFKQT
jgi:hypothetical protein